jgi:hypothetical protein
LAGAPELPNVCRSIIIPDDAEMTVRVVSADYYDVKDVAIAPSKGVLPRTVDPDSVPYTFGAEYDTDAFYPGPLATLRTPYVMRDYRGVVIELNPLQFNPQTGVLRVYTDVTLEVVATGLGRANLLTHKPPTLSRTFHQIYSRHFLNYGERYEPLDETGDLLIICHDAWIPNMQPFVDHKNAIGISTTIVGVSTIGNNHTQIKNHIQGVYDSSDLAFVLLVGDGAQVDTPYASGGSSDPSYSLLAGGDHYPDILVGRFSAETPAQVDTQVQRSVEYEMLGATGQPWFKKATGVASAEGAGIGDDGEADWVHMDNIRDDLLDYEYTVVDQIYDPGASASSVTAALNEGRGLVNYCGHGSTTSWGTTGFSTTHINQLVNDNMLPFINSVACVNGQFDGYTCFAEAWLRATHDGEPTGAIAVYASSVNQSWAPPMCAQDETVDLLVADAYFSVGALFFAGSCQMMDEYGYDGIAMFDTWHIFGDPSLMVRPSGFALAPDPLGLELCSPPDDQAVFTIQVRALGDFDELVTLSADGAPAGATIDFTVDSGVPPFTTTLTVGNLAGADAGHYTISISGTSASADGGSAVTLDIANGVPEEPVLTSPPDGELGVALQPVLTWEAVDDAIEYELQVATDATFTNVIHSATTAATSHTVDPALDGMTRYYWRVRGTNACGAGDYSAAFDFVTVNRIMPIAYDLQNGEGGTYTYYDDIYDGDGDPTQALAWLTGGLGELTDGVIAAGHWNETPGPYIGWKTIDPTITFHFDGEVDINVVTLYLDDSGGGGGVYAPEDVIISMGGTTLTFPCTDPPGDEPFAFTCEDLGLHGDTLEVTIADYSSYYSYMMLTEVEIYGLAGIEGDVDGDGDVDLADLSALLAAYEACDGDTFYNPDADFDGSGCVDLTDLATLLAAYGS